MKPKYILIMEDDPVARKGIENNLAARGYSVNSTGSAIDGLHLIRQRRPDLLILDLTLLGEGELNGIVDGFGFLQWLRYVVPAANFPVIIYTADPSQVVDRNAKEFEVFAVVRKEDNLARLLELVRSALHEQGMPLLQ